MKNRVLSGWSFQRVLYLILGGIVIVHSVIEKQWIGVLLGGYFAAMGLFAFGCAAGSYFCEDCSAEPGQNSKTNTQDVEFEEVKTK